MFWTDNLTSTCPLIISNLPLASQLPCMWPINLSIISGHVLRGEVQNREEEEMAWKSREEGESEMLWEQGDIDEKVILGGFF